MERAGVALKTTSAQNLAAQIDRLLNDANARAAMQKQVRQWMENKGGTADRLIAELAPIFTLETKAA